MLVGEGATGMLLPCYHIVDHCDVYCLLFWHLWRTESHTMVPSVLIDPVEVGLGGDTLSLRAVGCLELLHRSHC